MHAVEKGRTHVVRVLLKAKADVGKRTLDGNDAMYLAFIGKHELVSEHWCTYMPIDVGAALKLCLIEVYEHTRPDILQEFSMNCLC